MEEHFKCALRWQLLSLKKLKTYVSLYLYIKIYETTMRHSNYLWP